MNGLCAVDPSARAETQDGLGSTPIARLRTALNLADVCVCAHALSHEAYPCVRIGPSKKPTRGGPPTPARPLYLNSLPRGLCFSSFLPLPFFSGGVLTPSPRDAYHRSTPSENQSMPSKGSALGSRASEH